MKKIIIAMVVVSVLGYVGYVGTKHTLKQTSVLAAQAFNPTKGKLALLADNTKSPYDSTTKVNEQPPVLPINQNYYKDAYIDYSSYSYEDEYSSAAASEFDVEKYISEICKNKNPQVTENLFATPEPLFKTDTVTPAQSQDIQTKAELAGYNVSWEEIFKAGSCSTFKKKIITLKQDIETNKYNLSNAKNLKVKKSIANKVQASTVSYNNNLKQLKTCLMKNGKSLKKN